MPLLTFAQPNAATATSQRGIILLTLCLGVLVAQVDTSVVNLAAHPIGMAFSAPVAALQWVLDGYNLTYAVLLLTGGLLADLYGRRRAFQAGAAILAAASLACALAPTIGILIAARVAAGAGSALLLPASLAIVRVVWTDPAERRRALGVWASCNGLAFVIGPTLGGLLIEHFGWPSVFLISVPLALAALILAAWAIDETAHPQDRHFDLPGQLTGAAALGGLAFAAIDGHQGGHAWIAALAVSAAAFLCFLALQRRRGPAALVPLDLFRNRSFCGAIVATASMTFGIYGMIFLMPLVWQASGVLGPEGAGIALMPCALVFFLVSSRSGHLTQRIGVRAMTAGGTAIIGIGLLVLATTHGGLPLPLAAVGLTLTGIGMGLNTGPLMSVAVDSVTAARSGTASALINVARMTGATLGVAMLGAAFALWHGGAPGLRAAMLAGGIVQCAGAAVAYASTLRH
ncbi:MAG TPA: MFS transporter [Acetobacteraceae bacterium]|nr:MFS transporter [Acetobacteraceae bacterium]